MSNYKTFRSRFLFYINLHSSIGHIYALYLRRILKSFFFFFFFLFIIFLNLIFFTRGNFSPTFYAYNIPHPQNVRPISGRPAPIHFLVEINNYSPVVLGTINIVSHPITSAVYIIFI